MVNVPDDDVRLIHQIARRDEADTAMEALYDRYAPRLYSLSLRICGEPSMAEEAVQNTFLTVWRAASGYAARRGRVSSWLFAILRSRTLDLVRSEKRHPTEPLAAALTYDQGTAMSESVEEKVLDDELRTTVSELPDMYRRVIELSYFGGYTHREIARRLRIPLGTVKSRIRVGLERLARRLEGGADLHGRGTAM